MTIEQYIDNLNKRYKSGNATEHTFRGDLQLLLEKLLPGVSATNEPKRQSCGAPDFILTKKDIPVGYIEAKDVGDKDLDGKKRTGNKEQFDRYKASLNNLIFTDYLNFHLYRNGELVAKTAIAEVTDNGIHSLSDNFAEFESLIKDFATHNGQTITSSKRLAEMMAGKARLLSDVISRALTSDEENQEDSSLKDQMIAFKNILIHDITPQGFADVYAQTIAYGLFAARLHDPTLSTFSRQEAAELIPKSNPFLRKLFGYIAGPEIDDRIRWIVDNLAEVFLACNVESILKDYGKATQMEDPIIHFYETFLSEYDPKLRKARGVWYTPLPVVDFMVRAVDDVLKQEFELPHGIADTSKTKIKVDLQGKKVEKEVHRIQILDPATGTGTFLAKVIKHIYLKFSQQQGIWSNYVENHLLPRLNGFELLMASYAMAHLKLDLLLNETGYVPTKNQRFRVFLTNSLEEHHPETGTLFASWLSTEANEANHIKRDNPVMVVIGNPPYSGESANKGEWIMNLMEDYKKEPGGIEKLKERNPKWINDDYVKFIRYGQYYIEKTGEGILAFINPHGYIDNPTFRGMRWNLLKTFDKIFTIDLHGNAKKKETAPDGSPDQNVFDIMQGVSINIFIKQKAATRKNKPLAQLFHYDLYGRRGDKYEFLNENSINTVPWNQLEPLAPNYFFVNKDFGLANEYNNGFKVNELFLNNSVGIVTARDNFTIHHTKEKVKETIETFLSLDDETARLKYNLGKDVRDWQVNFAKKDLNLNYPNNGSFVRISYRPFDTRYSFYTGNSKGFYCYPRNDVMKHFLKGENIGLTLCKQFKSGESYQHVFITNIINESSYVSNKTSEITTNFPLYLYSDISTDDFFAQTQRTPNLNMAIVLKIAEKLNLEFVPENETHNLCFAHKNDELRDEFKQVFAPIDILDYIYAVLHAPGYRSAYKEFLKIDFPRIPYPKSDDVFWQMVAIGKQIREIHLLENPALDHFSTRYPIDGDNVVAKPLYIDGKIFINDQQYFDNVPQEAWEFFIGGYQPAQKWLKDRKDRVLNFDDILHYQKMIAALTETHRLMGTIDQIDFM